MNEQTTAKKVPAIATNVVDNVLTLTFAHGKTLALELTKLNASIREQAMIHGLKQKLVDAAALSCDPATGRAATIETKFIAVEEVFNRLISGEWNKAREGGSQSGGLLFRALIKFYDGRKTEAEVKTWLETKTEAEKTALRKNPKIAEIIESLRIVAPTNVDTDAMLDELLGDEVKPVVEKAPKSNKKPS